MTGCDKGRIKRIVLVDSVCVTGSHCVLITELFSIVAVFDLSYSWSIEMSNKKT